MKNIEQILGPGWRFVRMLGTGSYGSVYEIQRDNYGSVERAALKILSIPKSREYIDELYSEGFSEEGVTKRVHRHRDDIIREYSMMKTIKGHTNIVYCDDLICDPHENGVGWDIYIKMELLTPLMKKQGAVLTEEEVIRLGKDICSALSVCQKNNIIHRDVKPQNIFVSHNGDYKLGDFGIAKSSSDVMGGTKIGTYKYMAPEVYNGKPYGPSVDVYGLGLVMYWLLNEHRHPFLPLPPKEYSTLEDNKALERRCAGEKLPEPAHGSRALKAIVMKACAFDPKDRFQSADEMLDALNRLEATKKKLHIKKVSIVAASVLAVAILTVLLAFAASSIKGKSRKQEGWQTVENATYYYDENGDMLTGSQVIDGMTYYFGNDGVLRTGWQEIGGAAYHFDASGVMLTGLQLIDGNYFYFGTDGIVRTGWQDIDGYRYNFGADGIMLTGWQMIDGFAYYFSADGVMQTGWQVIDGVTFHFDTNGVIHTGIQLIDGNYFYFGADGIIRTGWQDIDGYRYNFGVDGIMLTGWQMIDGFAYYFSADGVMQTGWQVIDGVTFHFDANGVIHTGLQLIDGNYFYFGTDGIIRTGWQDIDGYRYNFGTDGIMLIGWQSIDGITYYFSVNGVMVTGEYMIDNVLYRFDVDGRFLG